MSNDIVKASVTPPPTKAELLQAAAQVIADENAVKNRNRWSAITKAREKFRASPRKAAREGAMASLKEAEIEPIWKDPTAYFVIAKVRVQLSEELLALKKAKDDLEASDSFITDPKRVLKDLKTRSAGHTPENLRVALILATPALRKAVKEFGEKLLATPTAQEKAAAIEVGGAP